MTEQSFMDFIDAVFSAIPAIQPGSDGYVLAVEMDTDYEVHMRCQELGMTAVQTAQHFIEINPNIEAVARELMSGYGVDISDTSFTTASIMRDKGQGLDSQSIADSYAHKRGMTSLDHPVGVAFEQGEKATIQQVKKPETSSQGTMHQEVRVTLSVPADIETESLRARMEMALAGEFPTATVSNVEEERHIYGVDDDNIASPDKEKMAFVLGMLSDISDHKLAALDHGQLKNLITDMRNAAREVTAGPQRGPKLPKI